MKPRRSMAKVRLCIFLIAVVSLLLIIAYLSNSKTELQNELEQTQFENRIIKQQNDLLLEQMDKQSEVEKTMREWLEEWQVDVFEASAYAPFESKGMCSDGDPTNTRTGTYPAEGRTIAVDPSVIPLGSSVYVEGWGWMKAEDTGGLIQGKTIDIMMNRRQDALEWGRRKVKVVIPNANI